MFHFIVDSFFYAVSILCSETITSFKWCICNQALVILLYLSTRSFCSLFSYNHWWDVMKCEQYYYIAGVVLCCYSLFCHGLL